MYVGELKPAIEKWIGQLKDEEKAQNTIKSYTQSLEHFTDFLEKRKIENIDKSVIIAYKDTMLEEMERNLNDPKPGRTQLKKPGTINLRLIALNRFLKDSGEPGLTVKLLKDTTSNTLDDILSEKEYQRILQWADRLGKKRIKLIIETLVGTGIRISELKAITVESLKKRTAIVTNKGKTRTIFIPKKLAKKLKDFCKEEGIEHGLIFHTKKDEQKPLDQSYIRKEMKHIAGKARGIKRDKVHAHAFRHFFAKRYANMPGANAFILPMLLGHSDKTQGVTALYTKPTTKELLKAVDDLEAYYSDTDAKKRKGRGK